MCSDIDNTARSYIEEQGYGSYFKHSLGHGVGIDVHELPVLKPKIILMHEEMLCLPNDTALLLMIFQNYLLSYEVSA